MVKYDQSNLLQILTEFITDALQKSLPFETKLTIDGMICAIYDNKEPVIFKINRDIISGNISTPKSQQTVSKYTRQEAENGSSSDDDSEKNARRRKKRKREVAGSTPEIEWTDVLSFDDGINTPIKWAMKPKQETPLKNAVMYADQLEDPMDIVMQQNWVRQIYTQTQQTQQGPVNTAIQQNQMGAMEVRMQDDSVIQQGQARPGSTEMQLNQSGPINIGMQQNQPGPMNTEMQANNMVPRRNEMQQNQTRAMITGMELNQLEPVNTGLEQNQLGPMNIGIQQNLSRSMNTDMQQNQLRSMNTEIQQNQSRPSNSGMQQNQLGTMNTEMQQNQLGHMNTEIQQNELGPRNTEMQQNQLGPKNTEIQQNQLGPKNTEMQQNQLGPKNTEMQQNQLGPKNTEMQQNQLGPKNTEMQQNQLGTMNTEMQQNQSEPMNTEMQQNQLGPKNTEMQQNQLGPKNTEIQQNQLGPMNTEIQQNQLGSIITEIQQNQPGPSNSGMQQNQLGSRNSVIKQNQIVHLIGGMKQHKQVSILRQLKDFNEIAPKDSQGKENNLLPQNERMKEVTLQSTSLLSQIQKAVSNQNKMRDKIPTNNNKSQPHLLSLSQTSADAILGQFSKVMPKDSQGIGMRLVGAPVLAGTRALQYKPRNVADSTAFKALRLLKAPSNRKDTQVCSQGNRISQQNLPRGGTTVNSSINDIEGTTFQRGHSKGSSGVIESHVSYRRSRRLASSQVDEKSPVSLKKTAPHKSSKDVKINGILKKGKGKVKGRGRGRPKLNKKGSKKTTSVPNENNCNEEQSNSCNSNIQSERRNDLDQTQAMAEHAERLNSYDNIPEQLNEEEKQKCQQTCPECKGVMDDATGHNSGFQSSEEFLKPSMTRDRLDLEVGVKEEALSPVSKVEIIDTLTIQEMILKADGPVVALDIIEQKDVAMETVLNAAQAMVSPRSSSSYLGEMVVIMDREIFFKCPPRELHEDALAAYQMNIDLYAEMYFKVPSKTKALMTPWFACVESMLILCPGNRHIFPLQTMGLSQPELCKLEKLRGIIQNSCFKRKDQTEPINHPDLHIISDMD